MPQTILTILALMITIGFSLSTQRQVIDTERKMVANEMEVMAAGIALESMEKIRTRAFDNAVVEDPHTVHSKGNFSYKTPTDHFSTGNTCKVFHGGAGDGCEDLDDYHKMTPATVSFKIGEDKHGNDIAVPFTVKVEVQYVDESLARSTSGPTYQKEVQVFVQDQPQGGAPSYLRRPIHLSRTYAYNFAGNADGHGGGSEGHFQGDGIEQFEKFMNWLVDKLETNPMHKGQRFRDWVQGAVGWQSGIAYLLGNKEMGDAWSNLGTLLKDQDRRSIAQWFNRYPETRDYIIEAWYGGNL